MVSQSEKAHWMEGWQRLASKISLATNDKVMPYLMGMRIGMAMGIARNDDFLIQFCGVEIKQLLTEQDIDARAAIGELESVVIFMKAAASKNRVVDKVEALFD